MGSEESRTRARRAAFAAAVVVVLAQPAAAQDPLANVRLVNVVERAAVARSLSGALRQFAHTECQAVLDDFTDVHGRPLREALAASGMSATEYMRHVFFYDATPQQCSTSVLARTAPGSRAIVVCGARFASQVARDSRHAEAVLIHETLHSIGLGENPPAGHLITERVRAHCGRW